MGFQQLPFPQLVFTPDFRLPSTVLENPTTTMEDHGSLRSAIATMATAAQWQRALLLAESGDIFGGAMPGSVKSTTKNYIV